MSSIYNIVAPTVTPPTNAFTASHLEDAGTSFVAGLGSITKTTPIILNNGLQMSDLIGYSNSGESDFIGTASYALNIPNGSYYITSSWANNVVNSVTSSTSNYLNYNGVYPNGTASYAMVAQTVPNITPSFNNSFIKGFAMLTGSDASNKASGALNIVTGYNIASVTPLGKLKVYKGNTTTAFCWGVTFANPINTSNYIVIGTCWEIASNSAGDGEIGAVFLPQTASILNKRTTTAFTMSAQAMWQNNSGQEWGMNFQILGY